MKKWGAGLSRSSAGVPPIRVNLSSPISQRSRAFTFGTGADESDLRIIILLPAREAGEILKPRGASPGDERSKMFQS